MRKRNLLGYVIAVTMLLTAQAQAAGLPSPGSTSLLIRYRAVGTDSFTQVTSTLDVFIYRDGLIFERLTDDTGKCQVVRASALPERLARLKLTLVQNRVATQQGACISEPPGEYTVEREVTWFGNGRRQHSYRYGIGNSFSGACPGEILQIDHAITAVFAGAINVQTEQTCP